ncbi:MAG: hypothetical protein AUK47_00090 [Deltaproteobacteria bacterium CG2_30_63_29]|nr:MAG: hypothetical protein AUK47_00090 [Deltaproteobacteria bacterium CG2_30_63_29]
MTTEQPERGDILIRASRRFTANLWVQIALLAAFVGLIVLGFMLIDLEGDLSHLDGVMLSGAKEGHYYAEVDRLASKAEEQGGKLENRSSHGSAENLEKLVAAIDGCDAHFAMVQDGLKWPDAAELKLLGRLSKAESLFFLSKGEREFHRFADLAKMTIGVGPVGSGTEVVAREILENEDFASLGLRLETHGFEEQLALLESGVLDLALFVIDEDAAFIRRAIRERGMSIVSFEHLDVIARQLPYARTGRIGAGQYDPVGLNPAEDKKVLRIGTLILSNGCASRSGTSAMLRLLANAYPDFVAENRDRSNSTGLPVDASAQLFFTEGGAGFVDRYFPWLVDIMPVGNWVYVVMCVSVLFNFMGAGHRFQLWRIDANRVMIEEEIEDLVGKTRTLEGLESLVPEDRLLNDAARKALNALMERLSKLKSRCRRISVSLLVPMGAEMSYRYQENLMDRLIEALDDVDRRLAAQLAVVKAAPASADEDAEG